MRCEQNPSLRYADGSEELYHNTEDPYEWTNLAFNPEYAAVKAKMAEWLPKEEVPQKKAK